MKLEKNQIIEFGMFPQDFKKIDLKTLTKIEGNIYKDKDEIKYLSFGDSVFAPENSLAIFKPLEWEVVKVQGDYAMLISVDILMSQRFSKSPRVTYDSSLVRKYLNKEFIL